MCRAAAVGDDAHTNKKWTSLSLSILLANFNQVTRRSTADTTKLSRRSNFCAEPFNVYAVHIKCRRGTRSATRLSDPLTAIFLLL